MRSAVLELAGAGTIMMEDRRRPSTPTCRSEHSSRARARKGSALRERWSHVCGINGILGFGDSFAVDEATLPDNVKPTHRSLFDGSLQGIAFKDKPAFSFQGHPEASPGPHDVAPLFDRFVASMRSSD